MHIIKILIIIIIPCWIFLAFVSSLMVSNFKHSIVNKRHYPIKNSLYDELPLVKEEDITVIKNVDCNTTIVECKENKECVRSCIPLTLLFGKDYSRKAFCLDGICTYTQEKCLNGGFPIQYFLRGNTVFGCICPDEFLGRYCQYANYLKPAKEKSFSLGV